MTLSYFAKQICSPELVQEIEDHIEFYKVDSFHNLDFDSQKKLSAMAMAAMGRESYECLVECKTLQEIIYAIMDSMESYNRSKDNTLIETIHKGIVSYVASPLDEIFQDCIEKREQAHIDDLKDHGFHRYQYPDNGEVVWKRA